MLALTATLTVTLSLGGFLADLNPHGVHLLEEGALAQAELVPPGPDTAPGATADSLRQQIGSLVDSRPSIGGPIALVVAGALLVLNGIGFDLYWLLLVGFSSYYSTSLFGAMSLGFLIGGLICIGVGLPLLIVGAVLLPRALRKRREIKREIGGLERQLRELELQPPRGLPPPMTQGDAAPAPLLLLASF